MESIIALKDKRIMEAVTPPVVSNDIRNVFEFIHKNSNLVTQVSGMTSSITGIDRYKMFSLAKYLKFDLSKYEFVIDLYEDRLLKRQQQKLNSK